MKILHCIGTLEGGGAERQLCYLAKALVKKGCEVHVVLLKGGINLPRLQDSGATIHYISSKSNYDFSIIPKLVKIIRTEQPLLVQCWQRPFDFFGSVAAMLCGYPFISVERTAPARYQNSIKGILRLFIAQFSRGFVSNSIDGQSYWNQKLIRNIPNIIIPNIIPFEELNQFESLISERAYIVTVGRLSKEKNIQTLIEAIAKVKKKNKSILLKVLGEGVERKQIQELIIEEGLQDNVHLLGFRKDVGQWVKNAKLFVSLSLFEGMPNAVLEAAALSTPMLLSDIPAHKFYFSEDSATYTNPNDSEEVATKIIEVIDNYDIALIKTEKAFAAVQKSSGSTIANQYIEFYKSCINKSTSSRIRNKSIT